MVAGDGRWVLIQLTRVSRGLWGVLGPNHEGGGYVGWAGPWRPGCQPPVAGVSPSSELVAEIQQKGPGVSTTRSLVALDLAPTRLRPVHLVAAISGPGIHRTPGCAGWRPICGDIQGAVNGRPRFYLRDVPPPSGCRCRTAAAKRPMPPPAHCLYLFSVGLLSF